MTTDTYPKGAAAVAGMDGAPVAISGFAKGSGMIEPNMATMLAYVFTDAAIPSPILQELLDRVVDKSFNAITVDGDTSTSDTVMLFATGAGGCRRSPDSADDPALDDFKLKLEEVMVDLATQIVKDGEGASEIHHHRCFGRRDRCFGQGCRQGHRQFSPGKNRHRGRGRQLGPHRHGGGKIRRTLGSIRNCR